MPTTRRKKLKNKLVRKRHLSLQSQNVNVVVKNTKIVKKRDPKPTEPVMSRNRLLPPSSSVYIMNQQPDINSLLSFISSNKDSQQPHYIPNTNSLTQRVTQPSNGLVNKAVQSEGLAQFLVSKAPTTDTPVAETSTDVISPKRTYDNFTTPTMVAPPNSEIESSANLTTIAKAYKRKERVRALLLANIDYVIPDKATKKLIETRDKLGRQYERDEMTEKIRKIQRDKVLDDKKQYETLLKYWQDTRERMNRMGVVRNYPPNTSVKDFEDLNEAPKGLMAQIYDRFGGSAKKPEEEKVPEDQEMVYQPKKLTYDDKQSSGGGGKDDFTEEYWKPV